MSNSAITWAWKQKVASGEKLVLVALADYAHPETHECWPGQNSISEMTGVSKRSVVRHLQALEALGLISRQRRHRQDGSRTSDCYVMNVQGATVTPSEATKVPICPNQGATVSPSEEAKVPICPTQGATMSPHEPLGEPLDDVVERARDTESIHDRCCEIIGVSREKDMAFVSSLTVRQWLNGGVDPELDVYPTLIEIMGKRKGEPPGSMAYFTKAVSHAKEIREKPLPKVRQNPQKPVSAHENMYSGFKRVADLARQQ